MEIDKAAYLKVLEERKKTTRVYQKHQMTGLMLAEILHDERHKALYIKLAKEHSESKLLGLARRVAETPGVTNRGAYFMRLLHPDQNDDGENLDDGE